jgi:hypothetical protein
MDKFCFAPCHKVIVIESFVSKMTFVVAKKDSISIPFSTFYMNFLLRTYGVNITYCNYIIFKKSNSTPQSSTQLLKVFLKSPLKKSWVTT